MGMYDTVNVPCPSCGTIEYFQSKGAAFPTCRSFTLESAPDDVLSNVNRHSPHQCDACGRWFAVDEKSRQAIVANEPPGDHFPINDWYRTDG